MGEEWKVRGFLSSAHRQAEVQVRLSKESFPVLLRFSATIKKLVLLYETLLNYVFRICHLITNCVVFFDKAEGFRVLLLCWQCERQICVIFDIVFLPLFFLVCRG